MDCLVCECPVDLHDSHSVYRMWSPQHQAYVMVVAHADCCHCVNIHATHGLTELYNRLACHGVQLRNALEAV